MLDPAARRARNAKKNLNNISEIRRFFHRNEHPIYFISPTNFNLLGIDEWVKNFKYVTYIDCYEGRHPNVFCPSEQPHDEFTSIEEINNYLLQHKEVIDRVERRGGKPKLVFLMFDENTEKLAKELGWQVWFPKAKLRNRVDNKIETVRIGKGRSAKRAEYARGGEGLERSAAAGDTGRHRHRPRAAVRVW